MDTPSAVREYLWDPVDVGRELLPHLLPWLDQNTIKGLSPTYNQDISRIEKDPLFYKRQVENLYNNGELLGPDDITDPRAYKVDWKRVSDLLHMEAGWGTPVPGWEGTGNWEELLLEKETDYVRLGLDMGADPSIKHDFAIEVAARNNNPVTVRMLLKDPRVDPVRATAFSVAAEAGAVAAADVLIQDPRVRAKVSVGNLKEAASKGSLYAMAYLVRGGTLPDRDMIVNLIKGNHRTVLQLLADSGRVKNQPYYQDILDFLAGQGTDRLDLVTAVSTGNVATTERLLQQDVMVPIEPSNIRTMFDNKQQATQKLLLQSDVISPSIHNNLILRLAAERQNYQVMRILLNDDRVLRVLRSDPDSYRDIQRYIDTAAKSFNIKI